MSDAGVPIRREYAYRSAEPSHTSAYLQQPVLAAIRSFVRPGGAILDAGCGNGWFSRRMSEDGFNVTGIDESTSGIQQGLEVAGSIQFEVGSVYDDFAAKLGRAFEAIVSLEVIEHLYDPRLFVSRAYDALVPGGVFIISTPYHGYLKNLILAVSGKLDAHFSALWDGGHIKFWSRRTLSALLEEAGFEIVEFRGAGRLPFLWKSMIVVARRR